MLDSPIVFVTLCYYGLSKNELSPLALCELPWRDKIYMYKPLYLHGGDNRDRTGNLQLAKLALSQLSYVPKFTK